MDADNYSSGDDIVVEFLRLRFSFNTADFAQRVVLLGDGRPIADGPAAEVLAGGWYFATETARILGGAGGALLPDEGVALLRAPAEAPV